MTRRQWFALDGVIIIALILAYPLQDVIRKTVIVPLAYLWWALGVLYSSFPQVVAWILLIILIAFMLLESLATDKNRTPRDELKAKPSLGQVEGLSESLVKMRRGTYYKWQIANRLGRLARDFLIQRGDRANTKERSPLTGRDWQPSKPIEAYLEAGLNGSFADYPNPTWPFSRPQTTPLDLNVSDVVKFLETQLENHDRY